MSTGRQTTTQRDTTLLVTLLVVALAVFVCSSDLFNALFTLVIFTSTIFCFVVAYLGKERKIGFLNSFLISFFLSPVIGLIFTLNSPRLEESDANEYIPTAADSRTTSTIADQLHKLNELRKEGVLTNEEFEEQKYKLLTT